MLPTPPFRNLDGMTDLTVTLPEDLAAFVEEEVSAGAYSEPIEYVAQLLRREQAKKNLRALIQEGLDSPIVGVADEAYFEQLRQLAREHATK